MEVNSPTRQAFPSGGQRLRKASAPLWQGQIIERNESSPLPILHVLRIEIRVPGVSQEVRGTDKRTTGSCYYNTRWNYDSAVYVMVPWGLEWAGIKAPWQVNSFSVGLKPDPWPLDLVMERWIQKAAFNNERDGKQRVKVCVCVFSWVW